MAKGALADPTPDAGRSYRPGTAKSSTTSTSSSSRASVLASVVPMLRRHVDDAQKPPLLTLIFSATSLLNTSIMDDVTEQPLYTIKTFGPTTTIKRADPWDGDTKTAEIRWSRTVPSKGKNASDGVSIHMRGIRWRGSETLLKRGTMSGGRKFNIPNYTQSLKWKRQGNAYWCTTAAVKGPIAILRPPSDLLPSELQIFETLHDKNDTRPMLVHHGVSTLLLDYLLITALFLVTDGQEWTHVQGADITIPIGTVPELPGLSTPKSAPGNFSTSNQQWRKIMYGEPIFRGRTASLQSSSSSEALVPTPTSTEQVTEDHPIYRIRRSSSPTPSTYVSESEGVGEQIFFSPTMSRPHSPASESIFSPVSRGAAPAHTYLDPSFYNAANDIPPVPPIPSHLSYTSEASHSSRSRPSSFQSTAGPSTRRLPEIPLAPVPPLVPRPKSTPPRPRTSQSIMSLAQSAMGGPSIPPTPVTDPSTTPRRPSRQLPRPPQTPAPPLHSEHTQTEFRPPSSGLGRARSQSQSHASLDREKWRPHAPYSQRTLPSPPTSSSRGGIHPTPLQLQRVLSEDGRFVVKDVDDDLQDWVSGPEPGAPYDMPPPAYNSINFSPTDSPIQGSASPFR
ncbi:hypothetical protein C0991_006176 [Blastosporella zonata]|nr:hypothetical protein C0991_006176 [Blastosporella zonata]